MNNRDYEKRMASERQKLLENQRRQREQKRAIKNRRIALASLFAVFVLIVVLLGKNAKNNSEPVNAETGTEGFEYQNTENEGKIISDTEDLKNTDETAAPLNKHIKIWVDAGHGYDDPGTDSEYLNGKCEKNITLEISLKIKAELESRGYDVKMTRSDDTYPQGRRFGDGYVINPYSRVDMVNAEGGVDLFVSIHCNSYTDDEDIHGTRLYYCTDASAGSGKFADCLSEGIGIELGLNSAPSVTGYGASRAYYVTAKLGMPAVLIEIGFVTNKKDAEDMTDPEWQNDFAKGVAYGIYKYSEDNIRG